MARQAIRRTWVVPGLGSSPCRVSDDDILTKTIIQKVRVAVVSSPFVGDAVNTSIGITNKKARFQSAVRRIGLGFIRDQVELLHEDGAVGKCPFAGGCEGDLLIRCLRSATVGY